MNGASKEEVARQVCREGGVPARADFHLRGRFYCDDRGGGETHTIGGGNGRARQCKASVSSTHILTHVSIHQIKIARWAKINKRDRTSVLEIYNLANHAE